MTRNRSSSAPRLRGYKNYLESQVARFEAESPIPADGEIEATRLAKAARPFLGVDPKNREACMRAMGSRNHRLSTAATEAHVREALVALYMKVGWNRERLSRRYAKADDPSYGKKFKAIRLRLHRQIVRLKERLATAQNAQERNALATQIEEERDEFEDIFGEVKKGPVVTRNPIREYLLNCGLTAPQIAVLECGWLVPLQNGFPRMPKTPAGVARSYASAVEQVKWLAKDLRRQRREAEGPSVDELLRMPTKGLSKKDAAALRWFKEWWPKRNSG